MVRTWLTPRIKAGLVNRSPSLWEGGDRRKIGQLLRYLPGCGVDATFRSYLRGGEFADIIHIFHISYPSSYQAFQNINETKIPLIVSTIYSGEKIDRTQQQKIVDRASFVLCLSRREADYVCTRLVIERDKICIIPNGVDPIFDVEPMAGEYVLCVGRVHPQKNQLNLAKACKALRLPLMCIGQIMDANYAEQIESEGAMLLPNREQSELVSFYQKAQVVACVSKHEVHPNVILEGGVAGANILLTNQSLSFTDGLPNTWLCPTSVEGIASVLVEAWYAPKNNNLKHLLRERTWEKIAQSYAGIYRKTINV